MNNPSKIERLLKSQDAVTEVMDFIAIIGILLLSFSIIGVAGYPVLKSAQETRYLENTKLSFVVLADNINKVALGLAPSRSIEIKIYGGRLGSTGDSTIKINATRFNSSKDPPYEEITLVNQQLRSIENYVGDTVVAYEGTAVWIKYPNGVILNPYRPHITNQTNTLVIPVVLINGNSSIGGTGMSRVVAKGMTRVKPYPNVSNVTITVNSSYIDGWRDFYTNVMSWDSCPSDCTVRFNSSNLDVYILNTQMDTEIE